MKTETLTHRERVIKTINGEKTDRIPIDLGFHFSTGISVFAYKNLREYLGLDADNIELVDNVQMLARVDRDILERFHCDTMLLNPPLKRGKRWNVRGDYTFTIPPKMNPEKNEDGEWVVKSGEYSMKLPKGGFFFEGDWLGMGEFESEEESFSAYKKRAEYLYKETDYYVMQMGFSGMFDGIEHACDMYTDPDAVLAFQEKRLRENLERFKKLNEGYGKYIQCIEVNSDLGMQNAPMIDPKMYEKFCVPYLKEFTDYVHNNSDIKIFMHSCGSIEPLIPYIIEGGVDILNPVQISASNMNPKDLKEKYGDKLTFWGGGCNTQQVLNFGTPEDVKENVKMLVNIFKPGFRFVFNQVHNIMGDIKPENIVAMLDTAYENAFY